MKRITKIERLFPTLKGRTIKIFTGMSSYWATAKVTGWTGTYLELENIEIWNGNKRQTDQIHANSIVKIEFAD